MSFLLFPSFILAQGKYQGTDPIGAVSYSLPKTVLSFDVKAVCRHFYAGPYADYAKKYLGINVKDKNGVSYSLVSVNMTPFIEADQSRRFLVVPGAHGTESFLTLTAQGLISVEDGNFGSVSRWRFPAPGNEDFSGKGVSANLTSEAATLYRKVKNDSTYNTVTVRQDMVVEKSLEERAKEAADMIISFRKKKIQIVTGNTDATFSGEAMGSVIHELDNLEKEYMTLFTGYSEMSVQEMKFDVVPSPENERQIYVAFRLSDDKGLVSADNVSGRPYLLEVIPDKISSATGEIKPLKNANYAVYRIPAVCSVRLTDGMNLVLQDRVQIYQLGEESTFILNSK
jgi:hypothetical protein